MDDGLAVLVEQGEVAPRLQGSCGASLGPWLSSRADVADGYLRAIVAALTWLYLPASLPLLRSQLRERFQVDDRHAAAICDAFLDPASGWPPSARIDPVGMEAVCELRGRDGRPRARSARDVLHPGALRARPRVRPAEWSPVMADVAAAAPYPRFSQEEYAERHRRIEALLEARELDSLVVFGNVGARAEIQYLTGWPPRHDSFLVVGGSAEPLLLVQLFNHVETAQAMAAVGQVRWGGTDSVAAVASELAARGARNVGTVGPIPFQQHARLAAALQGLDLVDATAAFRHVRLVKSEAEVEWTRRAAEMCDVAMATLLDAARPGVREYELGAAVEHAYAQLGGSHGICFIATAPMTGGGRIVPSQQWSDRALVAGDSVMIELSAGVGGYTSQILQDNRVSDKTTGAYADSTTSRTPRSTRSSRRSAPGRPRPDLLRPHRSSTGQGSLGVR